MYFIANWKMYGNINSVNTIKNVIKISKSKKYKKSNIIYCPPYTLINEFVKKTKNSKIKIGAQNCHTENNYGPHTGEISSKMIKNLGCSYVIIGHSENRKNGDNDRIINLKIRSALKEGLKVIFCIGENLKERKNKQTINVLKRQIKKGLNKIINLNKIILAYEPVWSIGTNKIPNEKDLNKVTRFIKIYYKKIFKTKNFPKVLYGGSVNNKNISLLSSIDQIDGFLIGGASQSSKKFIDIIKKYYK